MLITFFITRARGVLGVWGLGLLPFIMRELDSSLSGFFFSDADESIERMDRQTLLVLRAGVQSVSSVDKQIKPHEYTCS